MSFQPHPPGVTALTPISETPSTFVAPPPVPLSSSPLKQLHAPPVPFVPQAALNTSSPSSPSSRYKITMDFYSHNFQRPAIFSTNNGTRAKRELIMPFPTPVIRSNIHADVEIRATQLIEDFPEAKHIFHVPGDWYFLQEFFDGHDLWVEGADFCYYVILAISRKNIEQKQLVDTQAAEIDRFAYEWVVGHKDLVLRNPTMIPMTMLFSEGERRDNLEDMFVDEIHQLNELLAFHRHHLLEAYWAQSRQFAEPYQQQFPPHGQQLQLVGPRRSVNHFGQSPMVAPIMPQTHRIRNDSIASLSPRPVNDLQVMRRGSLQGQQGRQDQGYGNIIDTQRQITPNSYHFQGHFQDSFNEGGTMRPRGLSNTTQNSRGRDFSQSSFQGNGRKYPSGTPGGNSSVITPSRGPVYVRQVTPRHFEAVSTGNRVVSAPAPSVSSFHPANRITSGSRPHIPSPTNREQNIHTSHAIIPAHTDRGDLRTPRRYVSTSATTQGSRITSHSPINYMARSNDARVDNYKHENNEFWIEVHGSGESMTLYYHYGPRDHESIRTLHVTGFSDAMVLNHQLKDMMEECGKVDSIHYLRRHSPRAFVTFAGPLSVENAITHLNQRPLSSGYQLLVGIPKNLGRSRSGSNASQGYRNGVYNSSRDLESRPRRPSFRNPSNNYHTFTHSRHPSVVHDPISPPSVIMDQLQATIAEVVQHQSALARHMPLSNIENTHNSGKKINASPASHQKGIAQTESSGKKENVSPRKKAQPNSNVESISPKKSDGNGQNYSKRRKGSRQNTSTRSTPAATPVKSMSAVDLKDIDTLQISTNLSKLSIGKTSDLSRGGTKKNSFKLKNPHDSCRSDASFNADAASETTLSPVESVPKTRDTSFSAGSGRKDNQATSSSITKAQSAIDIPSMGSGPTTAKFKSKNLGKVRGNKKDASTASDQIMVTVDTSIKASQEVDIQKKDNLANACHSKKGSNISMASNGSLRKADALSATVDQGQGSAIVSKPECKSDEKMEVTGLSSVPIAAIAADPKTQSPKVIDKQWPSHTKSPAPSLDAKHLQNPGMGLLTSPPVDTKKPVKPSKPTVPAVAVPRAFETQPRPQRGRVIGLDVGTETWPFVRKFKGK